MLIPVCIMCVLIEVLEAFLPNHFTVIFSCNKFHMNFNIVNEEWGQKKKIKNMLFCVVLLYVFVGCLGWYIHVSVHTRSQQRDL